jgi:uncharacterized protein (DUF1778 family)
MAMRSERVEARLSPEKRARIERAARFEGQSLSSFIVEAAVDRADRVLAERTVTVVPADYFDRLLATLDEPDHAPRLERAARSAARRPRIG